MGGRGVDVIIPVYNAPELTRRAIESLLARCREHVHEILAWDDASGPETARLLDSLRIPELRVHHAPRNQGFVASVSQAFAATRAELVLVLNSDTEARMDFLGPLVRSLESDSRLAAATPAGASYAGLRLQRYRRRSGCLVTYQLAGYAFLVRRRAWDQVGGFDARFGRGYYEDADLSRRLVANGWWLGVHPEVEIHHESHGSFREVSDLRDLMQASRALYYELHPSAARQVVLLGGARAFEALDEKLRREADLVLEGGGGILWLRRGRVHDLPAVQVEAARPTLLRALALRRRARGRAGKGTTELWISGDAPPVAARVLAAALAGAGVALRRFAGSAG
jgi:GT2 family glycosyltransferase